MVLRWRLGGVHSVMCCDWADPPYARVHKPKEYLGYLGDELSTPLDLRAWRALETLPFTSLCANSVSHHGRRGQGCVYLQFFTSLR